jgi:hypothetical protein
MVLFWWWLIWYGVVNCKSFYLLFNICLLIIIVTDGWCRSKYPLAVVEVLLDALGIRLGAGYDIGCKFGTTLDLSELGPLARQLDYKSLVGSFHGHAHNRLCQLSHLATYVKGMGLEDLEGCERFFSKSNALASSLRYASVFHRQQKIVEFIKHMDAFETSRNLSTLCFFSSYPTLLKLHRRVSCQ